MTRPPIWRSPPPLLPRVPAAGPMSRLPTVPRLLATLALLALLALSPSHPASGRGAPGEAVRPGGDALGERRPPRPRRMLPPPSPPPREPGLLAVLVDRGLVSPRVAAGGDLFFRQTFEGNGRTCGTCHRVEANLTLDQATLASLPPGDPLFVAETRPELASLERAELLRSHGLILTNPDGFEEPTGRFVLRGIPHTLSLATSIDPPPDDGRGAAERTGWSGDGAPLDGSLRSFSVGAVIQHFPKTLERQEGKDFRLPTAEELDALEAYMLATGRVADTRLAPMIFEDPRAARGREIFLGEGRCFECHSRAGADSDFGGNRNFRTNVEAVPHPGRSIEPFPHDGGFGLGAAPCIADPASTCFGDGTFNTPGLVEAADTGPFFHNNVFATLEEAVAFYDGPEFNTSPAAEEVGDISLSRQDVEDVAALLRVLNAAFNIQLSRQRTEAARTLGSGPLPSPAPAPHPDSGSPVPGIPGNDLRDAADRLLELASVELEDAVGVLVEGDLHPEVVALLASAISLHERAADTASPQDRRVLIDESLEIQRAAGPLLGQGIVFRLGEGNLVF